MKTHTIQEFFDRYYLEGEQKFIGEYKNSSFVSQLVNDFGIPSGTVEFVGCIQNRYDLWDEYMILFKFGKDPSAEYLGECFKNLGKIISRLKTIPGITYGIQEVSVDSPDKYYILIYGLEDKE